MKKRRLKKKKIKTDGTYLYQRTDYRNIDYMERFEKAEKELIENGYSVINPAKVNAMLPEDATWRNI